MLNVAEQSKDGNHEDSVVDLEAVDIPGLRHLDQWDRAVLAMDLQDLVVDSVAAVSEEDSMEDVAAAEALLAEVEAASKIVEALAVDEEVLVIEVGSAVVIVDWQTALLLPMHQLDLEVVADLAAAVVGMVEDLVQLALLIVTALRLVGMDLVMVDDLPTTTEMVGTVAVVAEIMAPPELAVVATWSR